MNREITYGESVAELAQSFLSDDPKYFAADGVQKFKMERELSQDIQQAIEDFFFRLGNDL